MRIYNLLVSFGLVGAALGLHPAASFDGVPAPGGAPLVAPQQQFNRAAPLSVVPGGPVPPAAIARPGPRPTPYEALRSGTQALREGNTGEGVSALEYAAGQGIPGAMWKLGRMYADGDGVDQNKVRAFEYFRELTKAHAYERPGTPQARFVANAFVTLGNFYLEGIPNSAVKADIGVAHEMFRHAASYFGDPDAQYQLGRLFYFGNGVPRDGIQAARWFRLAALKGQRSSQAMLGRMLFKGEHVSRQGALGLFWLTVAKEGAGSADAWITELYASANAQATEDERALAYKYLVDWVRPTPQFRP